MINQALISLIHPLSLTLSSAIESYFHGEDYDRIVLKHPKIRDGWLPIAAVADLPRVRAAIGGDVECTPKVWICSSIKHCESELVQLHMDNSSIRQVPFAARLFQGQVAQATGFGAIREFVHRGDTQT
jgi:hypothetical protein